MNLTQDQKSEKFWTLVYNAQAGIPKKWKNLDEFEAWLRSWGGALRKTSSPKKGFVVRSFVAKGRRMSYALPDEFVEKCLVLGALP